MARQAVIKIGSGNSTKEFKLQDPGVEWYLDFVDSCKEANGQMQTKKYVQGLLDFVVIEPKGFKVGDFANLKEVTQFIKETESFLSGDL